MRLNTTGMVIFSIITGKGNIISGSAGKRMGLGLAMATEPVGK
jgi:hypothetical protein